MNRLVLCAAASLMIAGCTAYDPENMPPGNLQATGPDADPYDYCGISNFAWTDRGLIARGAQPSRRALQCLVEAGFKEVVNLRDESPGFDEAAAVDSLGMTYHLLPIVDDAAPSPDQVSAYMQLVEGPSQVFTHDAAGRGRMGFMDGVYLLWRGWSTSDVFERYMNFGAKIDCENGGNGQIQALHEIGTLLGRGEAWPEGVDQYGNIWTNCSRPDYMLGWDYATVMYPVMESDR